MKDAAPQAREVVIVGAGVAALEAVPYLAGADSPEELLTEGSEGISVDASEVEAGGTGAKGGAG